MVAAPHWTGTSVVTTWWQLEEHFDTAKWTVVSTTGLIIESSQQENLINTTQKVNWPL